MKIHFKILALALTCCLFASTAMADEDEGRAYVTLSIGQSWANNACQSFAIPTGASCKEKNTGFRAGFGYQYTPMWGLEASYGTFGDAGADGNATFPAPVGAGSYSWQLKARGLAIQAVTTVHMGDVFSVFGKFGLARVEFDEFLGVNSATGNWFYYPLVNSSRNTVALGGGAQFDVTPHAALRIMVETYGAHDIYSIYGQTTKVKLRTIDFGLVYKY